MFGRSARACTLSATVLFVVLAMGVRASAHTAAPTTDQIPRLGLGSVPAPVASALALVSGAPSPSTAWLALVAAIPILLFRRSRRAAALVLVLILLVFAFEASIHSVHHIGDQHADQCVVGAAATHLAGLEIGPISLDDPALRVDVTVAETGQDMWPAGSLRPASGRAPPTA